jgi:hypothetical protein
MKQNRFYICIVIVLLSFGLNSMPCYDAFHFGYTSVHQQYSANSGRCGTALNENFCNTENDLWFDREYTRLLNDLDDCLN